MRLIVLNTESRALGEHRDRSILINRYRVREKGKVIREKIRIDHSFIWVPGSTRHGTVFQ